MVSPDPWTDLVVSPDPWADLVVSPDLWTDLVVSPDLWTDHKISHDECVMLQMEVVEGVGLRPCGSADPGRG